MSFIDIANASSPSIAFKRFEFASWKWAPRDRPGNELVLSFVS